MWRLTAKSNGGGSSDVLFSGGTVELKSLIENVK